MESANKFYSTVKQVARIGRTHPFWRGAVEMITSAFSIALLVNDLKECITIPNWKWWLLVALVIFFITIFFHILEKNLRIDDLENEQPNLEIEKIGAEPQTPTIINSIADDLSKCAYVANTPEPIMSSDEMTNFQMSEETKDLSVEKGEKAERFFALVTNYPKSKEVVGAIAKNVTANIAFLNGKGETLFNMFDKVRWEGTPSPATRGVREQNVNSVDIKCGETKKLYFMVRKLVDGTLYIHNDDSYNWYLESQKISDKDFFVEIRLFAEKTNIEPLYYKFNPNNSSVIFTTCSYEDIYDC